MIATSLIALFALTLQPSEVWDWKRVPLRTSAQASAGVLGGEGGQWPRAVAISPTGNTLLLGIDVGGIFRSTDGGATLHPANVGFTPRGCSAFAFDPANEDRVLAIGVNSSPFDHHGIYLSEDRGASWRSVLRVNMSGIDEWREQLVFDPTSRSGNRTLRAYWSRVAVDRPGFGSVPNDPALYRTEDGGLTWQRIPNSAEFGGSILRHSARDRWLYAANERGVFRSKTRGTSFEKIFDGPVTGLDLSPSDPSFMAASRADGVWVSYDFGVTWRNVGGSLVLPNHTIRNVKVSPVRPNHMVVWRDQEPNTWDWARLRTVDGGKTWQRASLETSGAFLPQNARQGIFAWHPTNDDEVWSIGGDSLTQSSDGGLTFRYRNSGNNGILIGGRWSFSLSNPDVIFFGSQDYNGAITTDRGNSWRYTNISGEGWGGFAYGGYAVTSQFLVVGEAPGWGSPRTLKVSQNGGQTWVNSGIVLGGMDTAYGVPGSSQIAFASDHRTADGGQTWQKMIGCQGVITHRGSELWGVGSGGVVFSTDQGQTWQLFATTAERPEDLAVDQNRTVYAVIQNKLYRHSGSGWQLLSPPRDQIGWDVWRTVAVDGAGNLWAGAAGNVYATSVAVVRSTDGGQTWRNFTRQTPLANGELDGGREAICIRVHPVSGEVFVSTSCYGIWKLQRR